MSFLSGALEFRRVITIAVDEECSSGGRRVWCREFVPIASIQWLMKNISVSCFHKKRGEKYS